jgi:hypothetical protein
MCGCLSACGAGSQPAAASQAAPSAHERKRNPIFPSAVASNEGPSMRLLILTPLLAATLSAQCGPMPEVVLRTTTSLLQINVIATKKGASVPGLKKEDF